MNALDDPYRAIRNLGFNYQGPTEGYWLDQEAGGYQPGSAGGWNLTGYELPQEAQAAGFGSKYAEGVTDLGDGRLAVTMQQPGAHKYDTMTAIYAQGPDGQWVLQNDPMQNRTRQTSGWVQGRDQAREIAEKGAAIAGTFAAMYGGATALSGALGGAAAAGEGVGTLGTIGAGSGQVAPLASTGMLGADAAGLAGLEAAAAGVPEFATLGGYGGGYGTLGTIGAGSAPVAALPSGAAAGLGQVAPFAFGDMALPAIGGAVGGAAGGAMGGGAMNAAQIESAVGTGGYGASSAGPGGGITAPWSAAPTGGASTGGMGGWENIGKGIGDVFTGNASANTYANLLQGAIGLYGQNKAVGAMTDANNQSNALLKSMYDQNRADNQPLLDLRNQTLPQISGLMSNPGSIVNEPGYQFGLQQGQNALDNKAAGAGSYYSGAQMKGAARYNQDYAGTKLDQSLNRLMGVAGLGQVGATQNQQNTTNYGTQAAGNALDLGNVRGSGYMAGANTMGNALGNSFNSWQYDRLNGRP